ncbi:MAG TPA: TetR family transcriptional regulator [Solirubrobacteraceae bacterium]|jgi:AcrR family transcriptional regulator|nr:TetR family transcriptional regulator [Solirubrobacteraceae bacterium]
MDREDVARHQRARLYGGMIESIAQRGYARTTVAHVIGLAGVSRRAFYEQFANKEECFLATYDIVVARSRKLVLEAWSSERGWANRLHASCKGLLDDIVQEPKGAHLVLIDSLGIGCKARERLHLAGNAYERLVAAAFRVSPNTAPLPAIASRAIVGGVRHVVFSRIRENRIEELRTLTDELLDWVEAYRSPVTTRLNAIALKQPPDIPPAPAAFLASDDKRARVLGSVVHLTLDEGYGELTDPQIAQFAGISTEAFHKQFASKEECFLTVVDEFASEALQAVEAAIEPISTWSDAVPVAVSSFIEHIVSHPALLRMAFIDLFEVGPGMIGRMTKSIDRFTGMLADTGPAPRRAPEIASEAITGAVWDIISAYSSAERMRYLPCLSDHIAFVVLAPYTGPKVAIDAIEQARLGAGRRRSLVAAAQLAAPPMAQPATDAAADTPADSGAKTVTKLRPKTSAKSATKPTKPTKSEAGTAAKPAPKSTAKAAKPARKTAAKSTAKSAADKAPRTSAKASAKPDAKTSAEPSEQPARLPKRSASRSTPSPAGSSRSRPRPPK